MYFAPPSPEEPLAPLSIVTVVAPAAGVPSTTPIVSEAPAKSCSNSSALGQKATFKLFPHAPAVLAAHCPTLADISSYGPEEPSPSL